MIVISRFLKRYSKAHLGTSLSTSAATNERGFPKKVKSSSGPISRILGGDRLAVKVGVVQMEKVNDMGQSRNV